MATPKLVVTREQFDATVDAFENNEVFDPVLLDERMPDGSIITVLLYDDESIMLQRISEEGDFTYNILPDAEYWSGGRIKS